MGRYTVRQMNIIEATDGRLRSLAACFISHGMDGRDVEIRIIHKHLYPDDTVERDNKDMQKRIGTYITRFNRRMKGRELPYEIRPGELKRTYRLCLTTAAE